MAVGKRRRLTLIFLAVIVVLILGGVVGVHVAVGVLKGKVVEVLGPNSEIRDIRLGWFSVNVEELRIDGPSGGGFDTFMGLPRQAVLAFLMHNENKITVGFVLEGDINNPQFSINQTFTSRLAFAMAKVLGVDIGGMVKDVGTLGQKGGEAME